MAAVSESVRKLKKALADASASQQWDAVVQAAVEAFTKANSGAEIKQIVGLPGMEEGFLGEADAGAEIASALLDRAARFDDPSDKTQACAWLLRAAAFRPLCCVAPDAARATFLPKADVVEFLARAREPFDTWLTSKPPQTRASAAVALCWSRESRISTWLPLAQAEKDSLARASLLLLLAAHSDRATGKLREELAALALASAKGKPSPLTFAACVLGSRLGRMNGTLSQAFAQHVMKGSVTPSEWGWFGADLKPIKTSVAALSVLRWAELEDAAPLVEGLLKAKRPKARGDLLQLADALTWSAFEARTSPVPKTGVTAATLDPLQRRVIEALAEPAFQGLVPARLGLPGYYNSELLDFLAATELSWLPHPLSENDQPHFSALAARVACGELKERNALKALLESTSAEDALRLACCHSSATGATTEALGADFNGLACNEFCLAVVAASEKSGANVQEVLAGFLDPRGNEPYANDKLWANKPIIACALLDRTKGAPSETLLQFLEDAISAASTAEPLLGRIRKLKPSVRAQLIGRLSASGNTVPFLALEINPASVSKLVRFAIGPWGSTEGPRVEDALVSMGDAVLALIASADVPSEEQRPMVSELRDRVQTRLASPRKKGK